MGEYSKFLPASLPLTTQAQQSESGCKASRLKICAAMCHIRSHHNTLVIGRLMQVTQASSPRTCACMRGFAGAVVCVSVWICCMELKL
jgi:hypothetical protein